MKKFFLFLFLPCGAAAQCQSGYKYVVGLDCARHCIPVYDSNPPAVCSFIKDTALPSTCSIGDAIYLTQTDGLNAPGAYQCATANTWTSFGGGAGSNTNGTNNQILTSNGAGGFGTPLTKDAASGLVGLDSNKYAFVSKLTVPDPAAILGSSMQFDSIYSPGILLGVASPLTGGWLQMYEGDTTLTPGANAQIFVIDSTTHHLKRKNASNIYTDIESYPVTSVFGRTGAVVAQAGDYSGNYSLASGYLSGTKTAGTGGTTANLLVKIDNTGNVITAATADVGILGIAVSTVSSGATVEVATRGIVNCVADNTTVIGNIAIVGTSTAGRCRDSGQTNTTLIGPTTQVVGKFLSVASAGGNASVQLYGPGHYGSNTVNSVSSPLSLTSNVLSLLTNTDFGFTVPQTITNAGIGATSTDGLLLTNTTAAINGTQQYSPRIRLRGNGFGTTGNASQTIDWSFENQPVQGSSAPSGNLIFKYSINGAAYTTAMTVATTNGGQVSAGFRLVASGFQISGSSLANEIMQGAGVNSLGVVQAGNTGATDRGFEGSGFLLSTDSLTSPSDVGLSRSGTNQACIHTTTIGTCAGNLKLTNLIGLGTLQNGTYTVANLPTCNAGAEGTRAGATDLLTPTFLTIATGGGAVHGSVYCNGTNWVTD